MPDGLVGGSGSESFERLLEAKGLSERESQAVRSVVLSMTAAEAAPVIGVSPSTVGSYRQRAYAKLGVTCRAEFLSLPEVREWSEALACAPAVEEAPPDETDAPAHLPDDGDVNSASHVSGHGEECPGEPLVRAHPWAVALLVSVVILGCLGLLLPRSSTGERDFLTSPQGSIQTPYGEVPDVTGMRADAASMSVAGSGFCPEFVPCASDLAAGTVLGVEEVGPADEIGTGVSTFSWGSGSTGGFDRVGGDWDGYVVLVVAV